MKKTWYFLVIGLLVCACSPDPEKKLVGRWQEIKNPKGMLVFSPDHKGDAYWPGDNGAQESSPMTWVIIKGQNKVEITTPPGPLIFVIKPDRLIAPNGLELVKIK